MISRACPKQKGRRLKKLGDVDGPLTSIDAVPSGLGTTRDSEAIGKVMSPSVANKELVEG